MKLLSWPIVILLVVALVAQNTCLHGFAGKTSLVPSCGHCQHGNHSPAQDGIKSVTAHPNPDQPPLFVFSLPEIASVNEGLPVETAITLVAHDYQDALPDEILKPPRA